MNTEFWKPIHGYEGLYEISNMGRVKRLSRVIQDSLGRKKRLKEIIKLNTISKQTGYPEVNLVKDGIVRTWNIHTLIADAFIPNPNNLPCINHKDENRKNSVLSNLERCTYAYNNSYGSAIQRRRETLKHHYRTSFSRIRPITQYNIHGELIKTYSEGLNEIEAQGDFSIDAINSCLRGKTKTACGFVWVFQGEPFPYQKQERRYYTKRIAGKTKRHQKYVIKVDINGHELERYDSVSQAGAINGFDRHLLSRTKPKDGRIFINNMYFIIEKKENEFIPIGHKGPRPDLKDKFCKAVCQYSKEGEFIKEFKSVREAALFFGKVSKSSDISNCCNKKLKSAFGYIWRFKDEPNPESFKKNNIRKIEQYDFDGNKLYVYPSIRDAINSLGYGSSTGIVNNLSGKSHSAYGFIWKYAKD